MWLVAVLSVLLLQGWIPQAALAFAALFVIAVTVAVLVDRFIERPLRRLPRPRRKPVETVPLLLPA
jgi:peptidoglycan/LPS O-acetylase OafA/YrhL